MIHTNTLPSPSPSLTLEKLDSGSDWAKPEAQAPHVDSTVFSVDTTPRNKEDLPKVVNPGQPTDWGNLGYAEETTLGKPHLPEAEGILRPLCRFCPSTSLCQLHRNRQLCQPNIYKTLPASVRWNRPLRSLLWQPRCSYAPMFMLPWGGFSLKKGLDP